MRAQSCLDRESFQTLLANAYAVQESGIDTQSLFAFVEVQRSIATGETDVDLALHLVAECVRKVANATGVAIALLEADQLVYRAGSGIAATYVGRHVTAVLTISAHNAARNEILRVENAQTDTRIEAEICRQFGAKSLLILPIYREHGVAGVLKVLFSDAHTFQDREVRTYRLLAGLVKEAIFGEAQPSQKEAMRTPPTTVPHAIKQITSQIQTLRGDDKFASEPAHGPWISHLCGSAPVLAGELQGLYPLAKVVTTIRQAVKRAFLDKFPWNVTIWKVAAVGTGVALILVSLIVYDHRPTRSVEGPAWRANAAGQLVHPVSAKPSPAQLPPNPQSAGSGTEASKAARSASKRAGVGRNQVDHIAEDVTVRRLTTRPSSPQKRLGDKQVNFGDDVTVRYFAYKPGAVSQTRPASPTAQSVERSLPLSK